MKKSILLIGLIVSAAILTLTGCASSCDAPYGGTVEGGNNVGGASSGAGGSTSAL